ncbi:hypothetical protein [Niveibacterium sp. COAC-50]|uniref:flagellar basal body rod protein FlgB n=1 Tax=Niveibacterium sp. COAC-50 TaxID=2729384 RepID=UPI001551FD82|nr:hypothetical protein [Niveibacterium sp. COAC-50]
MKIDSQDLLVERLSVSMSMASFQHRVIAHNVANASTPGFVRQRVAFDAALTAAADANAGVRPGSQTVAAHARIIAEQPTPSSGIETDMMALSTNGLRYNALARALSRYLSIASAAATASKV